jgi:hypothetical protein
VYIRNRSRSQDSNQSVSSWRFRTPWHRLHNGTEQEKARQRSAKLPSVVAVDACDEGRHRLVGRPRLHLLQDPKPNRVSNPKPNRVSNRVSNLFMTHAACNERTKNAHAPPEQQRTQARTVQGNSARRHTWLHQHSNSWAVSTSVHRHERIPRLREMFACILRISRCCGRRRGEGPNTRQERT